MVEVGDTTKVYRLVGTDPKWAVYAETTEGRVVAPVKDEEHARRVFHRWCQPGMRVSHSHGEVLGAVLVGLDGEVLDVYGARFDPTERSPREVPRSTEVLYARKKTTARKSNRLEYS